MTLIAAIAGVATLISANVILAIIFGIAKGSSQLMHVLLAQSPFGWVIKVIGWFGAAWAGMSVFAAMGGM